MDNKAKIHIRDMAVGEAPFLEEMLFQAIFIPEGKPKFDKSVIYHPSLQHYVKDMGRNNDIALIAEFEGQLIGAIWTRLFSETKKGYAYVDAHTPELSMAIVEAFRSQGIGTQLLIKMFDKLQKQNYSQVSLSVDTRNFAYQLYLKFGFRVHHIEAYTAVMVKVL